MAMYLQQTFNLNDPPTPKDVADLDADSIEDNNLDTMPDWFQPPYPDGALKQAGNVSPVPPDKGTRSALEAGPFSENCQIDNLRKLCQGQRLLSRLRSEDLALG
ncbi:MAG: hypothetical protein Q9160_006635 [Pyrenula sp. 1 TL-2023]